MSIDFFMFIVAPKIMAVLAITGLGLNAMVILRAIQYREYRFATIVGIIGIGVFIVTGFWCWVALFS
jgi:hypothetical protein